MKLDNFKVETWMTLNENDCLYNLADTCAKSFTLEELLSLDSHCQHNVENLLNISLDYGPIEGSNKLKDGILKMYSTGSHDNIAICHGTINANELVLTTLLDRGDHMITMIPTYQQLYSLPQSFGVDVSFVELKEENQWQVSVSEFENLVTDKTKLICLNSPNNPTGTSFDEEFLLELVALAKKYDIYIMIDEAYRGLGDNETSISDLYQKGIATSGLSKILATPGLRIGWIKTPSNDFIKIINERRDYHIISSGALTDYLATIVFDNYDKIIDRNRTILHQNKEYLKQWLLDNSSVSCVIPDNGTVCFLKYNLDIPSIELSQQLKEDTGVFFVPGYCFELENHLRLGLANDPQVLQIGLQLFSEWLKGR